MAPPYIDKQSISTLLPMAECIPLMETMFRDLSAGRILQPLRTLMWLPDKKGILGMMPAHAVIPGINNPETHNPTGSISPETTINPETTTPSIIGVKLITIFHDNGTTGHPSHQGVIILFDGNNGTPLMIFDAEEITAIRTAAASAVATNLLANKDATTLAILGTGEQAQRHIESISLIRPIKNIRIWGRNKHKAERLTKKTSISITITETPQQAVENADIICTVTAATQPVLKGEWLSPGAHLNVVGSCTPNAREVDTETIARSKLFTDKYESLFNEAGDFLIPKKEGRITESVVQAEIGEVLAGTKPGRQNPADITLFKSLGIAAEDLYSAYHIYKKLL